MIDSTQSDSALIGRLVRYLPPGFFRRQKQLGIIMSYDSDMSMNCENSVRYRVRWILPSTGFSTEEFRFNEVTQEFETFNEDHIYFLDHDD